MHELVWIKFNESKCTVKQWKKKTLSFFDGNKINKYVIFVVVTKFGFGSISILGYWFHNSESWSPWTVASIFLCRLCFVIFSVIFFVLCSFIFPTFSCYSSSDQEKKTGATIFRIVRHAAIANRFSTPNTRSAYFGNTYTAVVFYTSVSFFFWKQDINWRKPKPTAW